MKSYNLENIEFFLSSIENNRYYGYTYYPEFLLINKAFNYEICLCAKIKEYYQRENLTNYLNYIDFNFRSILNIPVNTSFEDIKDLAIEELVNGEANKSYSSKRLLACFLERYFLSKEKIDEILNFPQEELSMLNYCVGKDEMFSLNVISDDIIGDNISYDKVATLTFKQLNKYFPWSVIKLNCSDIFEDH